MMQFSLLANDGLARRGRLTFPRGEVETPAFMPVGTSATVKSLTPEEVKETGAHILLGNTFHLMLRPGTKVIQAHGDLHDFMNWSGPILTDSGGFQVFSLGALRRIEEQGVTFRSPIDGSSIFLSPEGSMAVQKALGSDIVMCFDECPALPADRKRLEDSMEMSMRWAARSKDAFGDRPGHALFGIQQGGLEEDLRAQSAQALREISNMQDHFMMLGRKSATEKVASFLSVLAERVGEPIGNYHQVDLPMSRSDIADFLGLTTETISRTLTQLRKCRIIALDSIHTVIILKPDALRAMAQSED